MTALVARQPLHPLSMSATQRPSRRLSARLQEKEEIPSENHPSDRQPTTKSATTSKDVANTHNARHTNPKKRKNAYDEEDDGFAFSRVKKMKRQELDPDSVDAKALPRVAVPPSEVSGTKTMMVEGKVEEPIKKRRNKMSFSTPNPKEIAPVRRSKRLSDENDTRLRSPLPKTRRKNPTTGAATAQEKPEPEAETSVELQPQLSYAKDRIDDGKKDGEPEQPPTKIALPFADTPIIRRNKAMRENKGGKAERRSSLGMRGRRASSLIESGNSNALPHTEVEVPDFYKHIESDGLPEPRRMRQLLTWCATRAFDLKPMGAGFEDASAVAAARVIEEELLKDLSNRSELSDWFRREEMPAQPKVRPERPNPKNQQNAEKIVELEEQITRLRAEKKALESLLRPQPVPQIEDLPLLKIESSLLDEGDASLLKSLQPRTDALENISGRLKTWQQILGPTLDAFADGVHKVSQYRDAAENVAGSVLSICSEKLAERDKESRKKALHRGQDTSPRRDLNSVLRGLSRVDR